MHCLYFDWISNISEGNIWKRSCKLKRFSWGTTIRYIRIFFRDLQCLHEEMVYSSITFRFVGFVLLFFAFFSNILFFSPKKIFVADTMEIVFQILYQGVLVSFVALLLFSYSSSKLGSTRASLFAVMMPISGVLLSILFLDESMSFVIAGSIILMIVGMSIGLLPEKHVSGIQ